MPLDAGIVIARRSSGLSCADHRIRQDIYMVPDFRDDRLIIVAEGIEIRVRSWYLGDAILMQIKMSYDLMQWILSEQLMDQDGLYGKRPMECRITGPIPLDELLAFPAFVGECPVWHLITHEIIVPERSVIVIAIKPQSVFESRGIVQRIDDEFVSMAMDEVYYLVDVFEQR